MSTVLLQFIHHHKGGAAVARLRIGAGANVGDAIWYATRVLKMSICPSPLTVKEFYSWPWGGESSLATTAK